MAKSYLSAERLRELLHYDPATGVFTRRKWAGGTSRAGSIAGTANAFGHILIRIDGHAYLAHRLAWLYVYGKWPDTGMTIDHKFGKSNAIDNLREVTQGVNSQNKQRPQTNNKIGFLGVNKIKCGYRARIKPPNGKGIHIGVFKTAEEAHAAYVIAKRQLHEGGLL